MKLTCLCLGKEKGEEACEKCRNRDALLRINEILSSDQAFDADIVSTDVVSGRETTATERRLADVVHEIYRIVHPLFSDCQHEDWKV